MVPSSIVKDNARCSLVAVSHCRELEVKSSSEVDCRDLCVCPSLYVNCEAHCDEGSYKVKLVVKLFVVSNHEVRMEKAAR